MLSSRCSGVECYETRGSNGSGREEELRWRRRVMIPARLPIHGCNDQLPARDSHETPFIRPGC